MNREERKRIERVRRALEAVPYAHDGSGAKTAGVAGFVAFHKDMRTVRKACEDALFLILSPTPDLTKEEQDAEFEEVMGPAEEYIEQRKSADWASFTAPLGLNQQGGAGRDQG